MAIKIITAEDAHQLYIRTKLKCNCLVVCDDSGDDDDDEKTTMLMMMMMAVGRNVASSNIDRRCVFFI